MVMKRLDIGDSRFRIFGMNATSVSRLSRSVSPSRYLGAAAGPEPSWHVTHFVRSPANTGYAFFSHFSIATVSSGERPSVSLLWISPLRAAARGSSSTGRARRTTKAMVPQGAPERDLTIADLSL